MGELVGSSACKVARVLHLVLGCCVTSCPLLLPSHAAPAVRCGTAAPTDPTPTGGRGTAACARCWARRGRRTRSGGGRRLLRLRRRQSEQQGSMPNPHLDLHSAGLHSAFL